MARNFGPYFGAPPLNTKDLTPGQVLWVVAERRNGDAYLTKYTVARALTTRVVLTKAGGATEYPIRVDKATGRVLTHDVGADTWSRGDWRLLTEDDPALEAFQEAAFITDARDKARVAITQLDWWDTTSVSHALKTLNAYRLLMKD